jgi:uncharacterized membrane protein YdfJ with MMPL/SSD domain
MGLETGGRRSRGLAARAGRWSARHRKTAIWGWIAFVFAAVAIGGAVGTKTLGNDEAGVGESGRADHTLSDAFPKSAGEIVLVQARGSGAADPAALQAGTADVEARLGRLPFVRRLEGPRRSGAVSADGRSQLVQFEIPENDRVEPTDVVDRALAAVAAAQRAHPGLRIEEVGSASGEKAIGESLGKDFHKAEVTSLPITLAILVLVFGALVAAGVPLLLALTAVAATIGLLGPISHLSPLSEQVNSVVLLIGLAVGVDYSMFYLRREREERAAGNSPRASLETAAATSGRAILVSGFTVMVAMAGMYVTGDPVFSSFATGTILVVAVAMVGSLTVLPAVLAWLGDRVEKGRVPLLGRLKGSGRGTRLWSALVDLVLRRPLVSALAAAALLVVIAAPALSLRTANSGVQSFPHDLPIVRTWDRVQAAFPGGAEPAEVVVTAGNVSEPAVRSALARLRRRALADRRDFGGPITLRTSPDRRVAVLSVPLAGSGRDSRSEAALAKLRDRLVPATVGAVPGADVAVTGEAAESVDFNELLAQRLPWVFGFVLAAAFVLLLLTFRSLAIPLTAIGLNLLSVAAAYGVVVWVFQEGHLEGLLGFHSTGAVTSWLPLFLFVVLFGLSMDYHVFIVSRIREAYDRGMPTEQAVAHGIRTTAGVVTSAAAVMVAVFSIFATLSFLDFKEMGVGLAAAILIDATVVRAVLLPATMKLLGERNWAMPRSLGWLPRLGGERPARSGEVGA